MSGAATDLPLASRAVRGAVWVGGLRIFQRGAGFLRLLVLTHLLGPDHFGAMGIALLLVEVLNALTQTGFQTALIQRRGDVAPYLDAAWTALVLRGLLLFALLVAVAPYAAGFFRAPETTALIRVAGCALLLQAFSNIGVTLLERELDFRRFSLHHVAGTLADLAAAVTAALVFRNAWAFVIGLLCGDAVRLATSYWAHPHRPRLRLDLARIRELFAFGRWVLITNALLFLAHQGDDVLVGRLLGAAALGLYQFAWQLAHLSIMEASRIVSQVALPSYTRLRDNPAALRRAYLRVVQGTALVSLPVATLVLVLAPDFAREALPPRWLPVAGVAQLLALHAAIRAHGATIGPLLLATGRPHQITAITGLKCAVIAVVILPLVEAYGIRGAALSVLIAAIFSNAAANVCATRAVGCSPGAIVALLAVPLAASAAMGAFLLALAGASPIAGLAGLALHAALGLAVYAGGIACLGHVGREPLSSWVPIAVEKLALVRSAPGPGR